MKIYLDEKIFSEIKSGYLNINGLIDGNHAEYLNADHNLNNLDILVLAETKLDKNCEDQTISETLNNWNIFNRYDSEDGSKHMGLILLTSRKSQILKEFKSVTHLPAKRNNKLQIQGLIVRLRNGLNFGFIYCRSGPNHSEIKAIQKYFDECNFLMGDFNLSHRIKEDQQKIKNLCEERRTNFLREITRTISNNQLDYILIDNVFLEVCFATSYNNFISDHNSTVVRVGLNGNEFTNEIKERLTFDMESHMKEKVSKESSSTSSDVSSESIDAMASNIIDDSEQSGDQDSNVLQDQIFSRKFRNMDMTSCWLNSCIQLILTAIDHHGSQDIFKSELGIELVRLQQSEQDTSLDSTDVKFILVTSEDTRIATRMSELANEIDDPVLLEHRTEDIQSLRLNLISGQQCVRDFFLCLNENFLSWPDVYFCFRFGMTHSTRCCSCGHVNQSETNQMFVEFQVPPDNSNLNEYVEEYLNSSSLVGVYCENNCRQLCQAEKRSKVTRNAETEFLIVILTRAVETLDGYQLNRNRTTVTNDILIR